MLICKRCNMKNLDVAKFCKECGSNELYDPQAKEKLEKERQRQEELKRLEEERKKKVEEEIKIAQEERKKKVKQRKEFITKHKSKIIVSMMILFLIALASVYQYFYGGKYSRIYISELESKCHSDEASCKILQAIYKEKCDKGDRKACINAYIHKHKDLRVIKDNNQWNLVNENNKILVENVFDYTRNFSEGLAAVKLNGKWGFIDTSGKIAIEPKFDFIGNFYEKMAAVKLNGKWGFIDTNGKIAIEPKFDFALSFNEGLARVKLNGKWGFIDTSGKIAIEPKFDDVKLGFIEGLAEVLLNGKWVYIDKKGNIVPKD
ncbi:WG repeat-containing protein [Campylobacter lari]|nr:WG repeat-containing protein [Campylobacter lari]